MSLLITFDISVHHFSFIISFIDSIEMLGEKNVDNLQWAKKKEVV